MEDGRHSHVHHAHVRTSAKPTTKAMNGSLTHVERRTILQVFYHSTTLSHRALRPSHQLRASYRLQAIRQVTFNGRGLYLRSVRVNGRFHCHVFRLRAKVRFGRVRVLFVLVRGRLRHPHVRMVSVLRRFSNNATSVVTRLLQGQPNEHRFGGFLVTTLSETIAFGRVGGVSHFVARGLRLSILQVRSAFFRVRLVTTRDRFHFQLHTIVHLLRVFRTIRVPRAPSTTTVSHFGRSERAMFLNGDSSLVGTFRDAIYTKGRKGLHLFHLSANVCLIARRSRVFRAQPSRGGSFLLATFHRLHVFHGGSMTKVSDVRVVLLASASGVLCVRMDVGQLVSFPCRMHFVDAIPIGERCVLFKVGDRHPSTRLVTNARRASDSLTPIDCRSLLSFPRGRLPLYISYVLSSRGHVCVFCYARHQYAFR